MKFSNEVHLVGRLIKNNDGNLLKEVVVGSGRKVTNFRVSVPYQSKDKDGKTQDRDNRFFVTAWGDTGTILSSLKESDVVDVKGYLRNQGWKDKEGNKKFRQEIVAQSIVSVKE